jgi:hypothetical protein
MMSDLTDFFDDMQNRFYADEDFLALQRLDNARACLERLQAQGNTMTRDELRAIVALWNLAHPSEPYRIEVSEDGLTERLIRHDGTVAVTAHLDPRHITDFGSRWPAMSVKILNS